MSLARFAGSMVPPASVRAAPMRRLFIRARPETKAMSNGESLPFRFVIAVMLAFLTGAAHATCSTVLNKVTCTGSAASLANGWRLNITPDTGTPTAVSVASNPMLATTGAAVIFTATVSSSPSVGNTGTVTFTENGAPVVGTPNSGVANVVNAVASISTSSLPEGDHIISAQYHDGTNTFNDSVGTVSMREDTATSTPTLSASTWSYCNAAGITIPSGTGPANDMGAAAPNPSNVFVTNLPGTISTISVTLKGLHLTSPGNLESLLVGPNAASAPTTAQTFDFFSLAGGTGGSTAFGPQDTTFIDGVAHVPVNSAPVVQNGPTSYGATSYFLSPFFTLPATLQHAFSAGTFSFNTGTFNGASGGIYKNTLPNGTWSLYFNQNINHTGDGASSWCVNFVENAVTGTGITAHVGPAPANHMKQGGTGQVNFTLINNGDSNDNGSTGDPDGSVARALAVTGVLPSGLTLGTVPTGSPWNCTAFTSTGVTCTSSLAIAAGSSYPVLSVPVNVSRAASATATVSGFTFSGSGMTSGTFSSDTITIDPSPVLAISKSHTGSFVAGSTASWTLQVSNNAGTPAGATDGSTVTVTDTLPSGYTLNSFAGTGWSCGGSNSVTCTSNAVVAGAAGEFPLITLIVNVASNSPASVSNSAAVFGGGDDVHTNAATAALSGADNVTVSPGPPTISKSFGALNIVLSHSTSLSFTINNPNAAASLTGIGFTDTLPSGLVIATPNGLTGACGIGTITATAGTASAGLSGASLAPGTACTFSINVTATSTGSKLNTTGNVSSTEGGTGGSATASLTVKNSASSTTLTTACPMTFVADQTFTMTATVTGQTPTGSSAFLDGGIAISSCASISLTGAEAVCTTLNLATGMRSLTADYSGDVNNTTSNSAPLLVTVLDPADAVFLDGFEAIASGCPSD